MLNPIRSACGLLMRLGRLWERIEERRAVRRGKRLLRRMYYRTHGRVL